MVPVKSCSKGTLLSEETWLPSNWEAVVSKAAERCLCVQQGTAAIKADKRWNATSSLGVCSYSGSPVCGTTLSHPAFYFTLLNVYLFISCTWQNQIALGNH